MYELTAYTLTVWRAPPQLGMTWVLSFREWAGPDLHRCPVKELPLDWRAV